MDNIMMILFLACFAALILGMIKPGLVVRWGNAEKRNRKKVLKYYGIGLIASFILFVAFLPKASNNTQSASNQVEASTNDQDDKIGYDTGITYDQLARTPDDYKGKKAKFTGKVVQVIDGDNETALRVAVDSNYDNILFVTYKNNIIDKRILENDIITISGKSKGLYKYKATIGGQITVPSMIADKIEINDKNANTNSNTKK